MREALFYTRLFITPIRHLWCEVTMNLLKCWLNSAHKSHAFWCYSKCIVLEVLCFIRQSRNPLCYYHQGENRNQVQSLSLFTFLLLYISQIDKHSIKMSPNSFFVLYLNFLWWIVDSQRKLNWPRLFQIYHSLEKIILKNFNEKFRVGIKQQNPFKHFGNMQSIPKLFLNSV